MGVPLAVSAIDALTAGGGSWSSESTPPFPLLPPDELLLDLLRFRPPRFFFCFGGVAMMATGTSSQNRQGPAPSWLLSGSSPMLRRRLVISSPRICWQIMSHAATDATNSTLVGMMPGSLPSTSSFRRVQIFFQWSFGALCWLGGGARGEPSSRRGCGSCGSEGSERPEVWYPSIESRLSKNCWLSHWAGGSPSGVLGNAPRPMVSLTTAANVLLGAENGAVAASEGGPAWAQAAPGCT